MAGTRCGSLRPDPSPHTTIAWQDVSLWLLFVPPRTRRCREVVVRTWSNSIWSDLETHLEEEAPKVRAAQVYGVAVSSPS
jgi:hypothetical protein